MKNKTVMTMYKIGDGSRRLRLTVASDLHNSSYDDIIPLMRDARPDVILMPGDILGAMCEATEPGGEVTGRYIEESKNNDIGFAFMREAVKIAPVYYSVGNHEVSISSANKQRIIDTGVVLLDNDYISINDFILGGLSTGGAHGLWHKSNEPDLGWLDKFSSLDGKKLLMCHHPEYWMRHIVGKDVFLTVAGHAHGGQWRAFGRGLLAPGQGLFPKYTSGIHRHGEQYLAISRGLRKEAEVPRINNPPEVITIDIMYD